MLKQYDFSFSSQGIGNVYSELAVKIHGVLMHSVPGEIAVKMHEKKYHPFSLFCVPSEDGSRIITRVTALCEDADSIVDTASSLDTIDIKGMGEVCICSGGKIYSSQGVCKKRKSSQMTLIVICEDYFLIFYFF